MEPTLQGLFLYPEMMVIHTPHKPKRPCSYPGCPKLTDGRFCEEHTKQENQRYERYRRDPETKKRYGGNWIKIRTAFLAAHPLCEVCQQHGRLTPATEVHHIKDLSDGGTHDYTNLMPLCKSCHSQITASGWNKNERRGEP